jgi:hypothetical protein
VAGDEHQNNITYAELNSFIPLVFQRWFTDFAAFAGPLQWYCDWDRGTNTADDFDVQGLATNDYRPKQPAFGTFQSQRALYMKRIAGAAA